VAFHDGSPLTAADVAFCIQRAAGAENTQWAFILAALEGVEVVDWRTVRAHLHHPHAPFLADLALFAASIYPGTLFEQLGKKLWQHPIGTGPFTFAAWTRGNEVVLTRHPHSGATEDNPTWTASTPWSSPTRIHACCRCRAANWTSRMSRLCR
jgi:peptide/nickel transport system substrate-binding protein